MYVIHILVVAPPEYVNIYSTRRVRTPLSRYLPRTHLVGGVPAGVRTHKKSCSSGSRFSRRLSETTGHRLLGTQKPQMVWLLAWVWFSLTTEFLVGEACQEAYEHGNDSII